MYGEKKGRGAREKAEMVLKRWMAGPARLPRSLCLRFCTRKRVFFQDQFSLKSVNDDDRGGVLATTNEEPCFSDYCDSF